MVVVADVATAVVLAVVEMKRIHLLDSSRNVKLCYETKWKSNEKDRKINRSKDITRKKETNLKTEKNEGVDTDEERTDVREGKKMLYVYEAIVPEPEIWEEKLVFKWLSKDVSNRFRVARWDEHVVT